MGVYLRNEIQHRTDKLNTHLEANVALLGGEPRWAPRYDPIRAESQAMSQQPIPSDVIDLRAAMDPDLHPDPFDQRWQEALDCSFYVVNQQTQTKGMKS